MTKHESVLTDKERTALIERADGSELSDDEFIDLIEQAILAKQAAQVEPVAVSNVTKTAPKKIYLNIFTDEPPEIAEFPQNTEDVTWADDIAGDDDVAYIRADLVYTTPPTTEAQRGRLSYWADKIDPFTRKEAPDHLTMTCVAKYLREAESTTEAQVEPVAHLDRKQLAELKNCNGMSVWAESPQMYHPTPSAIGAKAPPHLVAVYTTPPASSALVEAAEKVSRAWAIEGDYVTAMNAAVTELRTAIEAEKKGRV